MTQRKYISHPFQPHPRCSQIHGAGHSVGPNYVGNLFCNECPDRDKIPMLCKANCDWPFTIKEADCPYSRSCPCNQEDNPKRRAAMAKWLKDNPNRREIVMGAFRK